VQKTVFTYWFCRIYVLGVFLLFYWVLGVALTRFVATRDTSGFERAVFVVPAFFPAVCFVLNWAAFPIPYSVFGNRQKTPAPNNEPYLVVDRSWIVIGRHFRSTVPTVRWEMFDSGLGVAVQCIGRAFIPRKNMVRIEQCSAGKFLLEHTCNEIRSPIFMPEAVANALCRDGIGLTT